MGRVRVRASFSWMEERLLDVLVNTGATYTVLPPELAHQLGLAEPRRRLRLRLANGQEVEAEVSTVVIRVGDREAATTVALLPGTEPLLGVEALEALGLKVNPATGSLEPTRSYTIRA